MQGIKGVPFNPLKYKKNNKRWLTNQINNRTYLDYFERLQEMAINMFEWKNLPDTVSERFLELTLCEYGFAVYFNDEDLGDLALTCMIGGQLDVYRIPIYRRAYSYSGYQRDLNNKDSVLIFNNYLHTPSILTIQLYAMRLYEIERAIEVNVKAQKTPVAILCDETERLSYENLYKDYDGNQPIIMGSKSGLDLGNVKAINTTAPFVADKLNTLKRQIWNEALTFFGIENNNSEKRERLVSDEVISNMGGVEAQRYIMLNARREAAEKINKMFGTNIEVNFRQERSPFNFTTPTTTTTNDEYMYVNKSTGGSEKWLNTQLNLES